MPSFETYDGLHIFIKRNDTKFIIYAISAMVDFSNDIKGCKEKKDEVVAELSGLFNRAEVYSDKKDHDEDISGESKVFRTSFFINPKNEFEGLDETIIHHGVEIKKIQGLKLFSKVFTHNRHDYSHEAIKFVKEELSKY